MTVVRGSGPNVRAILTSARRLLSIHRRDSMETLRSGGEDGMYRVHLASGDIVEAQVIKGSRTQVEREL